MLTGQSALDAAMKPNKPENTCVATSQSVWLAYATRARGTMLHMRLQADCLTRANIGGHEAFETEAPSLLINPQKLIRCDIRRCIEP